MVNGDIEACLRLIKGRGFTADIAAPARTADGVVRRRRVTPVASTEQDSEVCCPAPDVAIAA